MALTLITVAFAQFAAQHDAAAWIPASVFACAAAICGALAVYQELYNMKLPKIAALDLRSQRDAEIIQFFEIHGRGRSRTRTRTR